MTKRAQQLLAFAFGVIFLVTMLALAIAVPNPTPFQYTVFRIVLALAAAGVAAMIPGFIQVAVSGWLRAGGALAVFAIVFFYNPASLVALTPAPTPSPTPPAPTPSASAVAIPSVAPAYPAETLAELTKVKRDIDVYDKSIFEDRLKLKLEEAELQDHIDAGREEMAKALRKIVASRKDSMDWKTKEKEALIARRSELEKLLGPR